MYVLKSNSLSIARLYFGLLAMLLLSLACTPQHLNGKNTLLQKSSQSQLSPLHEPHFGIKSLAYKPEEESNVIFLAASDNQPIRVATRRDIPQNMGIDLQDMTMNGANLPTEIQPALSVEEVKNRRKALLKEGRRFLKEVFKLIQSELRTDFLARKHALQSDKELLPGKVNKPERKDLQAEMKRLEDQFHDRNKILKNAFKSDWRDLESRIKTVLPKPEKGFKTQALNSSLLGGLSGLMPSLAQAAQQLTSDLPADRSEALRHALGGIQEKNQPLISNMIWLNERDNPHRNIYQDSAVYKMINGSGQVGTLIPPVSEVVDQSIARKTLNSKIFIDESILYFNSLKIPSFNSQLTIQDIIGNLKIDFSNNPEAKAFINNDCRNCPPSIETRIYPTASTIFKGDPDNGIPDIGVGLTSFIDINTSQELEKNQKFIMSIRLKSFNQRGENLFNWLKSQVRNNPLYHASPASGDYIINELDVMSKRYILDGADLVLSLESPEMCQTPDYIPNPDPNHPTPPPTHQSISPEMRVGSDIWLTDLINFKDLSNEGEKSAIMAINEDNLLVQGTYKLRLKIKYPHYYSEIKEFCGKVTSDNECILYEQDVAFLDYNTPQGPVPGIIKPSANFTPSLTIEHVANSPSYERSYIGYYIKRKGSNPFNVDVKLAEIDVAICNPLWDLRCVDYKKSLLEFNHQSLDTGVYSVIAKFANPQNILELTFNNTERRFAALHLQYATFAHLTDKPLYLDGWGLPEANASQQPKYLLRGLNHFGYYFNADQSLPNPPLQPIPNTLPAHNQAVQVGSEIVYNALSKMKQSPSTFLSEGYFSEGVQNTMVELIKPHAEGMNQAFDAFRLVNFDSANPKPYLQIGFVANLHNLYTANNNLLNNGSSQPVYLEVVDAATGNVRARFPRFVKLGSQTYASVYWDGQPHNLTPEEEDNLPDDAALDADGAPNYLTGEYSIRLSLPPDEEQDLVAQPHFDFNFNSRRSYRPYTDVTWPTISPVSSDVQVKIQASNSTSDRDFPSNLSLNDLRRLIEDNKSKIADLVVLNETTTTDRLALIPSYYKEVSSFTITQNNQSQDNQPLRYEVNTSDLQDFIKKLKNINSKYEIVLRDLQTLANEGTNSQSEVGKIARKNIRSNLKFSRKEVIDLASKGVIKSGVWLKFLLSGLNLYAAAEMLDIPPSAEPYSTEEILRGSVTSLRQLATEASSTLGKIDSKITPANFLQQDMLALDLLGQKIRASILLVLNQQNSLFEDISNDGTLGHLDLDREYYAKARILQTSVIESNIEVFDLISRLNRICDKCFYLYGGTNFINSLLNTVRPSIGTSPDRAEAQPKYSVTETDLKCRICAMKPDTNQFEESVYTRRSFEILLSLRNAMILKKEESNDPLINKQVIGLGELSGKVIGFTWLKGPEYKLIVSHSGDDFKRIIRNGIEVDQSIFNAGGNLPAGEAEKIIKERISKELGSWAFRTELKAENIIFAKESKYLLDPDKSVYPSYKRLNNKEVNNDAEIKILETLNRYSKRESKQIKNVNIFTDKVACEYCQDVVFRINNPEVLEGLHPQALYPELGTHKNSRTFENVQLQGQPLWGSENLHNDLVTNAINFIRQVKQQNSLCNQFSQ
ncbi:MAG: hypothetical protein AB7I41_19750 [Candidatus Sericytochromatia bacterium]